MRIPPLSVSIPTILTCRRLKLLSTPAKLYISVITVSPDSSSTSLMRLIPWPEPEVISTSSVDTWMPRCRASFSATNSRKGK